MRERIWLDELEPQDRRRITELYLCSVAGILLDQHRDTDRANAPGSWGRSTIDYCFLATQEPRWDSKDGSITQTAWALRALREARNLLPGVMQGPVSAATRLARDYVVHQMQRQRDDPTNPSDVRHNATCVLAYESLGDIDGLPKRQVLHLYLDHYLTIVEAFSDWARAGEPLPIDMALIGAYANLVAESAADGNVDRKALSQLTQLHDAVSALSKRLAGAGVRLGTPAEGGVLSPLLQSAMFLHTISGAELAGCSSDIVVACETPETVSQWLVDRLADIQVGPAVDVRHFGVVDPWTVTCCAVSVLQSGACPKPDEPQVRDALRRSLGHLSNPGVTFFCNTTHWSILARSLCRILTHADIAAATAPEAVGVVQKATRPNWLSRLPEAVRFFGDAVLAEKLGVWNDSPEQKRVSLVTRTALLSYLENKAADYGWSRERFTQHRRRFYPDAMIAVRQGIDRAHVMVAGYSSSGKTTVCGLLSSAANVCETLVRATTDPRGAFDKQFAPLSQRRFGSADLVARHQLWGNWYGFFRKDITDESLPPVRLYQVGWSLNAIEQLHEVFRSSEDQYYLLLLKPTAVELCQRLETTRNPSPTDLPKWLEEASSFYQASDGADWRQRLTELTIATVDTTYDQAHWLLQCLLALRDLFGCEEEMIAPEQEKVDIAILTALPLELDALLRHFGGWTEVASRNSIRMYHRCTAKNGLRIVAACASNMGPVDAALLARDMVAECEPGCVILVGITGGVRRKVSLGDVVIADQVVDYEPAKETPSGTKRRPRVYPCDPRLTERLLDQRRTDWARGIRLKRPRCVSGDPVIHKGLVLSGSKVVADEASLSGLTTGWEQTLAVEMELAGVAAALHQGPCHPAFSMVKCVCDYADGAKNDDCQEYAADVAAALTASFLLGGHQ